jgi:hypothetical protein
MMKKYVWCLAIALCIPFVLAANTSDEFDAVFRKLAVALAGSSSKLTDKTVAVYGFEVIGRPKDPYATYATEKLTDAIVNEGSLLVIERSRINEVLAEQNLSVSGVVDAGTAAKIGKVLAVDGVIIGTIHVTDTNTEFIARIIQSEKGLILASASERVDFEKEDSGTVVASVEADTKGSGDTAAAKPETKKPAANPKISTDKTTYKKGERITITFSGLPGNDGDWFTLVPAAAIDSTYEEWFYTGGETSGTYTFKEVQPGKYEVRLYYDWPSAGYVVQARLAITVAQ